MTETYWNTMKTRFKVIYQDNTVIRNLKYDESMKLFNDAFNTDNPARIAYDIEEK